MTDDERIEIRVKIYPENLRALVDHGDIVDVIWLEELDDGSYAICAHGPKAPDTFKGWGESERTGEEMFERAFDALPEKIRKRVEEEIGDA